METMIRKKRKPMSEINVVPYIDVMLVLLIVFMVTAPMLNQGIEVDLPQANNEEGVDFLANDFEQIIELSNTITTLPDAGVPTKDILNNLESNLIRTALDQTNGNAVSYTHLRAHET